MSALFLPYSPMQQHASTQHCNKQRASNTLCKSGLFANCLRNFAARSSARKLRTTHRSNTIGKNGANTFKWFVGFVRLFLWQIIEKICLKAPGNYSASFWSYYFSICLCERPKLHISMNSGFFTPVGTLIYGFEYYLITLENQIKTGRYFPNDIVLKNLNLGNLKNEVLVRAGH